MCERVSEKESVRESLSVGERVREEERRKRERESAQCREWLGTQIVSVRDKGTKKMFVVPKCHTCRWIYIHEI